MPPTPLVRLDCLGRGVYGKIEFLHASGSMKHRSIPPFIEAGLASGDIRSGSRLAIRSAGAAAISTAWAGNRCGLPVIAVLPATAPDQVARTLRWLGATVHRLDNAAAEAMMGELESTADVYVLHQESEPALRDSYREVAAEIIEALPGTRTIVAGIGTGLAAMGLAAELRTRRADCQVIGVEPAEAPVASGGLWQPHGIPGLAPPKPRPLLDVRELGGVENIRSSEAWDVANLVARRLGIFLGPSSGATAAVAAKLLQRGAAAPIVAICACSMHEYLELAH